MLAFAEEVRGLPPGQVIGSAGETRCEAADRERRLIEGPGIAFIDDEAGEPVAIEAKIGRCPPLVAGNSDGDFGMLEWATAGGGPRLGLVVHHTDAAAEWAHYRDSPVGRLARGVEEAPRRGWLVVDMARDRPEICP